jgi:hypothetical protein
MPKKLVTNNLDRIVRSKRSAVPTVDGDNFNEGDIAVFKEDTYGKKIKNSGINVADLGITPPEDKTLSYDIDDRLETLSDANGTKTFSYDIDGKLTSIVGTGIYVSKNFIYSGDQLVTVDIV